MGKKQLSQSQSDELLNILRTRFEKNKARHEGIDWNEVQSKLEAKPTVLWSLNEMEVTEGEPDVIGRDVDGKIIFCDCSAESPKGRRSLCYDDQALQSRKEHKPKDSAVNLAEAMGIELITETEYRDLQKLGKFDLKTSSWVATPAEIRKLGGAVFCDRRYNTVFLYHNGAESYYSARAFRGKLKI